MQMSKNVNNDVSTNPPIERRRCIFNLSTYLTVLDSREFRLQNINSFFCRRRPRRRRCLSSLIS